MTFSIDKSNWRKVRFGDFAQSVTDRVDDPSDAGVDRYVGLEHLDPGSLSITRWGHPSDVEAQKLRFAPGDVIFGRRRAYQRKVAQADFEGICSAHALVLRAKPEFVLHKFLPVFLSSDYFLDRAIKISVGSLSPTVNWRDLAPQEFLLPPLSEQQRIADLLWGLHDHGQALTKLRAQTELVRRESIRTLCRPTGAPSVSIADVADVLDNRRVPVSEAERAKRIGSVPYYGATGQVGWIDESIFNERLVLIGEDGAPFNEWRERPIAYEIDGPSWVNNHAHVLRARSVSHQWLLYSLMHFEIVPFVTGTTRGKLNLSSLRRIPILLPEDMEHRAAKIAAVTSRISKIDDELGSVRDLLSRALDFLIGEDTI